jgi:hypothetical protein
LSTVHVTYGAAVECPLSAAAVISTDAHSNGVVGEIGGPGCLSITKPFSAVSAFNSTVKSRQLMQKYSSQCLCNGACIMFPSLGEVVC